MLSAYFEVSGSAGAAAFAVSAKGRRVKTSPATESKPKPKAAPKTKAAPKARDPQATSHSDFRKLPDEDPAPRPYRETFGEKSERVGGAGDGAGTSAGAGGVSTPDAEEADCWDYMFEDADKEPPEEDESESRDSEITYDDSSAAYAGYDENPFDRSIVASSPVTVAIATTDDVDDLFFLRRKERRGASSGTGAAATATGGLRGMLTLEDDSEIE